MKTQAILEKHAVGYQDGVHGKAMNTRGLKGDQKKAYQNGWHEGAKSRAADLANQRKGNTTC